MDHSPRRMSEISHLFLSDVRDKQTGGAPRPQRTPPGAFHGDVSIDLTPEEFAKTFENGPSDSERAIAFKPVQAVLAHHLGERMPAHVRHFAASLCGGNDRVGIVYANAENIRIACVDHHDAESDPIETESFDADRVREVLVELNQDVACWLIVLPDPRDANARELLKTIKQWTLLTGADHDSIVSGYRTIKGLADLAQPSLGIAVFGAESEDDVQKTRSKLAGVCEQFLHLNIGTAVAMTADESASEHALMEANVTAASPDGDGSSGDGPWDILRGMIAHAITAEARIAASKSVMREMPKRLEMVETMKPIEPEPATLKLPTPDCEQVIDLPHADTAPAAIIQAIVKGGTELIESPIKAPAHPDATIAVSRNRELVLLAVAKQGLADLRSIAMAYRWMNENRSLIAMAIPQFSIDAHATPQLRLLVDHADATADLLQPLLASGNVTVQAYRKLRWGAKTGLLLEAA